LPAYHTGTRSQPVRYASIRPADAIGDVVAKD